MMIYCTRKVDESVERKVDESVEHDDLLHTEGRRVGRT